MASKLVNRQYALTWRDFRGRVPRAATMSAEIKVDIVFTQLQTERTPSGLKLKDNVIMTVALNRAKSWAKPGAVRTSALLNHEQGHYNITALTARDMFIDLMQIKQQSFSDAAALKTALNDIKGSYNPQAIQDKYDAASETDHGDIAAAQTRWDGYIKRAFTQARTPAVRAPDGASYKIRLRDVLRAAGKI